MRIVILGGGFGGAYAARAFAKLKELRDAEITLVDRNNYLLFYPLLVEAGVGSIEARHVVIPLRKFLPTDGFKMAEILSVDLERQQVEYRVLGGTDTESTAYDHLVIGLGSITRVPNIPGLVEHGFRLKTLVDAIGLRDRGIRLLEMANTLQDPAKRKELLTCIVVGANFTGIEFAGEYHAFLTEAAKSYRNVRPDEIRMVVMEYGDRILSATTQKLSDWCSRTLTNRGVELRTHSTLKEVGPDYAISSADERIRTHTVLWAAGIAPNPLLPGIKGLPLNKMGYIDCTPELQVTGYQNVWAIGDAATVPAKSGKPYMATAQTSSRQGPHAAKNIAAAIGGRPLKPFDHKPMGSFAAIGRRQAAADVFGLGITGFLGWVIYRGAYLAKMPSLGMKLRLLADWTTEIVFRNEPVQLGVHRFRPDEHAKPNEPLAEFEPIGAAKS